jgi:hypothetical protein
MRNPLFGFAIAALAMAACSGSPSPAAGPAGGEPAEAAVSAAAGPTAPGAAAPSAQGRSPSQELARSDTQGAVEVTVSPSFWTRDAEGTLEFEVSMETHSVELSMDLAQLATLQTDTGLTLQALDWSGGEGHHVTGVLRFPSATPEGRPLLQNAALLILTLRDVDAPTRVFQWDLASLP